ncbi:MAG TPA: hypothetical protein VKK79_05395 [Candidatus Lokiarchaeia archaeon]|nr:hypothetical protein [Candidatus Lokiarchaeia archaeon]
MKNLKIEPIVATKLKEANITDPLELLFWSPEDLANACELLPEEASEIISQVQAASGINSLDKIVNQPVGKIMRPIPTFAPTINLVIGGGIFPKRIYEVYGEFRSGKTQLCHALAVSFQNPALKRAWKEILYVDTEETFRPERIVEIAQAAQLPLTPAEVLEHVTVVKLANFSSQRLFFRKLFETVKTRKIGLLLVDSFTNHFRKEIAQNFEQYSLYRSTLLEELATLVQIRDNFATCIVLTNQVRAEFDPAKEVNVNVKPVADYILAHFASEIIFLRVAEDERHYFRVMRSQFGPEVEIPFILGPAGLEDP